MNRKSCVILSTLILTGVMTLVGTTGNLNFNFPETTNAEQRLELQTVNDLGESGGFSAINQLAQDYKANPSYEAAQELINRAFDGISVVDVPEGEKIQMFNQIAAAHYNGSSNLQESNIVVVINDLAARSDAPGFAYTNAEQVEVTRKYLNRLLPDLVSANGGMTDIESFVVFAGLLSQKIDNEDFMVTPEQFTENMNNLNENEIPGRPEHSGEVEITQEPAETYQMLNAINNYVGSKNALTTNELVTMLGIQ